MGFAEGFQRLVLLAASQIGHVGDDQVVAPRQQARRFHKALGAEGVIPAGFVFAAFGCGLACQRRAQKLAQFLIAGAQQVALGFVRRQQAAEQGGLGKDLMQPRQPLAQMRGMGGIGGHQGLPVLRLGRDLQTAAGDVGCGDFAHAQRLAALVGVAPGFQRHGEDGDFHAARVQLQPVEVLGQYAIHRFPGAQALRRHAHGHQHQEGGHQKVTRAAAGVEQLEVGQ